MLTALYIIQEYTMANTTQFNVDVETDLLVRGSPGSRYTLQLRITPFEEHLKDTYFKLQVPEELFDQFDEKLEELDTLINKIIDKSPKIKIES